MEHIMNNTPKNRSYLVVLFFALITGINIFLYMKTKKMKMQIESNDEYYSRVYDQKIDSLSDENADLTKMIIEYENRLSQFSDILDSIEQSKQKTKIKYVNKFKEISDASADGIVNQLRSVFTENGIDQ